MLWDEEIGRLSWDNARKSSYFNYNPDWISKGVNIAPLVAPVSSVRVLMPVYGEEEKIYQHLPSFIADSLPDAWGNQLFEIWRQDNHIANADITPLDKLSFIGKRGMGALEFIPEVKHQPRVGKVDLKSLSDLAEKIFRQRQEVKILPEESITMQSLLTVGTSAGGRQPKAIIAINKDTGEIRSGQIAGQSGFEYYLLKFGDSEYSSAELEMTYYEMATNAGIRMMPSRLYPVEGNNHFLTLRFDRDGEKKLHIQTLAAIQPGANSYEDLVTVCRKLHLPESDCQEVFRRMVFNILANNTDDHNKNFSFIMTPDGKWRLSPAYDLTYIFNTGGYLPEENHCMYVRAKLRDITRQDVMDFARNSGIRRPAAIIRDVANSLKQFRSIAQKYKVKENLIGRIETYIDTLLVSWEEKAESDNSLTSITVCGKTISNLRIEQTYKGNYHLFATVDGKERKFVITRKREEYSIIENTGIANLSAEQYKEIFLRYNGMTDQIQ